MKLILVIVLSLSSLSIFADDENSGEGFAKSKEMILSNIDKKISLIQSHKTCVSASTSREDLKSCRQKHRKEMEGFKSERKEMKSHFKDEMKTKRDERKKNKKE